MTPTHDDLLYWWEARLGRRFRCVYVLGDGAAIKIGTATDFRARWDSLQCGNSRRLEVFCIIPGAGHDLEARLHRWLQPDRIRGEWFEGPLVEVVLAKVGELAQSMVRAYDGSENPPRWKGHVKWPAHVALNARRVRKPAPVTTRFVDPSIP